MSFLPAHTKVPITPCQCTQKDHDNPSCTGCTWLLPPHRHNDLHKLNSSQKYIGADHFSTECAAFSLPFLACFPSHLCHIIQLPSGGRTPPKSSLVQFTRLYFQTHFSSILGKILAPVELRLWVPQAPPKLLPCPSSPEGATLPGPRTQ